MSAYAKNPAWVNRLLKANWAALSERVDPAWLPTPTTGSSPKQPQFQEYGCGHYGCVLPTTAPAMVLKITSDPLEAHFVASALKIGKFPEGIVKYYAIYELNGELRGRPTFVIWRDEAFDVGCLQRCSIARPPAWYLDMDEYQRGTIEEFAVRLGDFQTAAGQFKLAFDRAKDKAQAWQQLKQLEEWAYKQVELDDVEGQTEVSQAPYGFARPVRNVERLVKRYRGGQRMAIALRSAELLAEMMANEPGGYLVGQSLAFYIENDLLLADVHQGNIGRIKHEDYTTLEFVITDPGHVVPLSPEAAKVAVEHV